MKKENFGKAQVRFADIYLMEFLMYNLQDITSKFCCLPLMLS